MSLIVWLPLISNTKNIGLKNSTITTTGTLAYNAGKLGKALTFNNTGICLNPAPLTTATKEFSFAFWYKPTTTNTSHCIYNGRTTTGGAIGIFRLSSNDFRFDDGSQHTFSYKTVANTWQHIVFTRDASNIKLYVDGVLQQTMTSTDFTCTATYASIGLSSTNTASMSANNLAGQLNDYRIYNHVLSLKEINELRKGLLMHLPLSFGANPNLTANSATVGNSSGNNGNYTHETIYYGGQPVRRFTVKGSSYGPWGGGFTTSNGAVVGNTYTWSCYVRGSDNFTFTSFGHERAGRTTVYVTKEWTYVKYTWTYGSSGNQAFCFYGCSEYTNTNGAWLEVKNLKIEEGSIATPYIPHVDEEQYSKTLMGTNYLNECSGYELPITKVGSNFTPCESPKRTTATTCGTSSCINLGTSIKIQYPFSFAFWFNTSDLTYNNNRLISCTEGGGWNIEGKDSGISWTVGTGTSSNAYKTCVSTKTREDLVDGWHHIVCTYDGLKSQMYLDGVLDNEVTHFSTATPVYYNGSNAVFLCGESGSNATTPANVYTVSTSVSDFRFYASILSADDVKDLYSLAASIDNSGKMYCYSYVEE